MEQCPRAPQVLNLLVSQIPIAQPHNEIAPVEKTNRSRHGLHQLFSLLVTGMLWLLIGATATSIASASEAARQTDSPDANDDTEDIETETTSDSTAGKGLEITGDLRPIYDYFDLEGRDGESESEGSFGARLRVRADIGVTQRIHVGTRVAFVCFTEGCDPEIIVQSASDGLDSGTLTLDELFLHYAPTTKGTVALGRLQTRFVLRGGVFAKSLDRNDSNNVNITWTDGLQATYRANVGWHSSFVLQRNSSEGSGSIRREPLEFDDSDARVSYFAGTENTQPWGNVVQRAFDVSYLPAALLTDGIPNGRREDYWGLVGRLVFRFPQRSEGVRLRTGFEIGYAPKTQTPDAARLQSDVSGLAWDIVASLMDFLPGHSIGVNYAQTGAGWLISPQYRPNEELFEIRYQWRPKWKAAVFRRPPTIEPRLRWREDLEQLIGSAQKRQVFDMYLRLTWEF